jgi:hypothetical protein
MDDDETLKLLRAALAGADDRQPPVPVLAAAVAAGTWTRLDEQLATLVADSADSAMTSAGMRGSGADVRALTYTTDGLTIECELAPDALLGQAVPVQPGITVELVWPDGTGRPLPLQPDGSFHVRPAPAGPVGIRCRRPGRPDALTPWLLP